MPATLARSGRLWDHLHMRSPTLSVLVLGLLVLPTVARAADAPAPRELLQPKKSAIASPITDRFALRGTYYQPALQTDLRFDSSAAVLGSSISAEDTLGMDNELNQGNIEMIWRLTNRQRFRVDFYSMSRTGDVVLDQLIRFGDDTYRATDRVTSGFNLRMLGLTYNYSFLKREKIELGAGLGLHLIQAEGRAAVPVRLLSESFDVAGPFATGSVDGTYRITKRFSANIRAQYLGGNAGTVDGSFGIYHADVQFRFRPNLAFGLGYAKTTIDLTSTDTSFAGSLLLDIAGPEAFVRVSF
jgi:hypothetical protein